MTIESLPQWAEELAAAFKAAGPEVSERSMFGGRAFVVDSSLIGLVELKPASLLVRLRLDEPQKAELAARAHFDPQGSLPTLLIVTDDDRDYAMSMIPHAYRFARAPQRPAPRPAPTASGTAPRRRRSAR